MKWFTFLYAMIFLPLLSKAQGENNIWTFYPLVANVALNFNSNPASVSTLPATNGVEGYSIAVCKPNGQLHFFVRLTFNTSTSFSNNIFKADGTPVPGSNLKTGVLTDGCMPVVIPEMSNPNRYYIFYSYSNGLLYSLLDMGLNNGQGGIVGGQKDVVIAAYGSVTAQKMTAVKGCDGVWLVVRSRIANAYYSYHVKPTGLDTTPVESEIGNFTIPDYNFNLYGFLKASQDGTKLAICGWTGIELYDFEKCSGILKNARVLDTSGNGIFSLQNMNNHTRFQDVCFSPDGSKLYVTENYANAVANPSDVILPGKLFQFDLSQLTLPALIASKTLILTNYPSLTPDISLQCNYVAQNPLGSMKLGPDGKLYIDNGSFTCLVPASVPAGYNPGPAFHTVNIPNQFGLLCLPQHNTVVVNSYTNNLGGDFYRSGDGGKSFLQQQIVTAPHRPDTLSGQVYFPVGCFLDSMILNANPNGSCYRWDNDMRGEHRSVFESGTYYVSYFKDCSYTTDTFYVKMVHTPGIRTHQSCPGMHMGRAIANIETNTSTLNYIWRMEDGSILRSFTGNYGDTITGLDPDHYKLQITSTGGCDNTLSFEILSLPKPAVVATPIDTIIRYGDSVQLHAEGAVLYTWWPTSSLDTASKADPISRPLQPIILSVVGINEYGCMDTAEVSINIDFTMPDFVPNAFSPNGDGVNDVFNISNITYQKIIQFKIFNRYGQLIFSTLDGHKGWDGTQNGGNCDVGTYFFLIELDYPNGVRRAYKGDVVLLR